MVPDATAAEAFCTASFWLIITTSVATPLPRSQSSTVRASGWFASSEKISPPQKVTFALSKGPGAARA